MLDIQGGQSIPVAPAVATPPPQPAAAAAGVIPTVTSPSNRLTLITAGIALGIVAAAGGYVSFVRADRASMLATRNREISTLKQQLGTPERVSAGATADQLKLGLATVQTAFAAPSAWTPLLRALADRTPSSVVLSSVTIDSKLNLRMNGSASTYGDVATFMAALAGSPLFAQVGLDTSAKSDTAAGPVFAFALKAIFVPPTANATTQSNAASSAAASSPSTTTGGASDAR